MPSFVLIHPTVWPQCTNVTDTGQTDRQRTDGIGRTVLQTVAQKPFWSLKMKVNFVHFGDINGCIPKVAVAVYIKFRDITRDASLTYFHLN